MLELITGKYRISLVFNTLRLILSYTNVLALASSVSDVSHVPVNLEIEGSEDNRADLNK